jgi:hypothetical protein
MNRLRWVVISSLFAFAVAGAAIAAGDEKADKKKAKAAEKPSGLPPGASLNACGCYMKPTGGCVCTNKKAKCECPGECEPAGCDEKRNKELEKEASDAMKRAQEEEKKREEAENKKIQDEEKKRQAAQAADEKRRLEKEEAASAATEEGATEGEEAEKPAPKAKKPAKKK